MINNNQPTPETDAAWQADKDIVYRVETSRKLERERDDTNAELNIKYIEYDRLFNEAEKIRQERDEAREERDQLKQLLAADSENVDAYLGVCIERDEAMKELEEYRSIAENIGAKKAVSEKEKAISERDETLRLGNNLADECERILGLGLHQNTLTRFKAALEAWRKNT